MHQFAAVQVWDELDPGGKEARLTFHSVKLVDLLVEGSERGFCDGSLAQEDNTFVYVIVIDDAAIGIAEGLAELPEAHLWSLHDVAKIADADRRAILHLDDGGGDVVGRLHESDSADVESLLAALDESAAGVDVVGDQRLLNLRQRETVRDDLAGIELNLIFARGSAERVD